MTILARGKRCDLLAICYRICCLPGVFTIILLATLLLCFLSIKLSMYILGCAPARNLTLPTYTKLGTYDRQMIKYTQYTYSADRVAACT